MGPIHSGEELGGFVRSQVLGKQPCNMVPEGSLTHALGSAGLLDCQCVSSVAIDSLDRGVQAPWERGCGQAFPFRVPSFKPPYAKLLKKGGDSHPCRGHGVRQRGARAGAAGAPVASGVSVAGSRQRDRQTFTWTNGPTDPWWLFQWAFPSPLSGVGLFREKWAQPLATWGWNLQGAFFHQK